MPMFDHEKLDVYRLSLEFVQWTYALCGNLKGLNRNARDQLIRASQSIPLNIAEGNGKYVSPDRRRFQQIACGSAMECAATLDVLGACQAISREECLAGKKMLRRIVEMLVKLMQFTEKVGEEVAEYNVSPTLGDNTNFFENENENENEDENENDLERKP
ncbi:four helix bundle protein [Candidatus Sumerlaeota bacterium]|nr:four helix bundle protein [Candidatus Sumerlaeota bacterium]